MNVSFQASIWGKRKAEEPKEPRPNLYTPADLDKAVDSAQRALNNYNSFPGVIYSFQNAQNAAQIILLQNLNQKVAEIMAGKKP